MESPASIMKTLSDERRFTDIFIAIPENNAIKTVQHFPVFRALQECISCIVFWDYKRKIGWGVKNKYGLSVNCNICYGNGRFSGVCASGAMVGVERNMDIFGVSVLGVATAVGGGMIRDIVLGIIPPAVFTNPVYALVSVLASCIVFFIFYFKRELLQGHRRETYDKIMLAMDSVGLGILQ